MHKFGEQYIAAREHLADVMRGIAELAIETDVDITGKLPIDEIDRGLGTPFLFVVCGEVNAGKSTLVNGLFGQALCKTNVLPETDRVLWYRYAPTAKDNIVTPMLEERFRPISFLRDFNLIDTPGTNSVVRGHQEITERFLPAADLILFTFPVSNPWGAASWELICKLPEELLDKVALVIQQADQREPKDIEVITGHLADLSNKRIGRVPPIFAVSGKTAFLAKQATPFAKDDYQRSGFAKLEDFIGRTVCQSPVRRAALETWRSQASNALRTVEDGIENHTRVINDQGAFIAGIDSEIDQIRETFVQRLPRHLSGVAEVFEREALVVGKRLREKLRIAPSFVRLFFKDNTGTETEAFFIERLQSAVTEVAEQDGQEVAASCQHHWRDLAMRVQQIVGIPLVADQPIEDTIDTARQRFVRRITRSAGQGIGNLKVRNNLEKELRKRQTALKSFTVTSLLLIIIGASCGALGVPWVPWILLALALLFIIGGILAAHSTRKTISSEFQRSLLDTCGSYATTLRSDYEDALRIVFSDYSSALANLRAHHAKDKLAIEPRLRRWQQLFLTLKAIEQEL